MAGMLPGVECARRRRFHQSGGWSENPQITAGHGLTRRSSFCLYTTSNHDQSLLSSTSSSSYSLQRSNRAYDQDEKLGGVAREAKERLDERLRSATRKSDPTKRNNNSQRDLQIEVFGLKKNGGSRRSMIISWAKSMGWKPPTSNHQLDEECAICLEQLKAGEALVHLPCTHRFHSTCLVPWLESNAHCPCCRMGIQS